MKFVTVIALFAAAVFATEIAQEDAKIEAGCPCRGGHPKPPAPRVCRQSSSSSSSLCPRNRRCGCPSSSSSECCKPVTCPRHPESSSTSELPTAGRDSTTVNECVCCPETSSDCGFLRVPFNAGYIDRRCECNPCNCDPCGGRRDDGCGC